MEAIFCNPGYHLISEKILSTLDHETLMSCKEALHHRRTLLSDPTFWIQKGHHIFEMKKIVQEKGTASVHVAMI